MITRIPVVDDTGDGQSGTAITAAWWTQVQDMIDARWNWAASSVTGVVNDLDIGEADTVFFTGATDLFLTGILGPANPLKSGKPLRLIAVGAGRVYLMPNDVRSANNNQFYNTCTSGPMPLVARGHASFVHSGGPTGASGAWWMIEHNQGAFIDLPVTAAMFYLPNGGTLTPNLSATSFRYSISGKVMTMLFAIYGSLSVAGGVGIRLPAPYTAGPGGSGGTFAGRAINVGIGDVGMCFMSGDTVNLMMYSTMSGGTWGASASTTGFWYQGFAIVELA